MSVTVFPTPTAPASTAKSPTTVIINSTQNWTAPTGVNEIELFLVAGGGGGGGAGAANGSGAGGGGGGVLNQIIAVTPGTSYTVTIGGGGSAGTGASNSPGGNGSNSTFGSLATSYGGAGGQSSDTIPPASGQVGSGGGAGNPSGQSGCGGGASIAYIPTTGGNSVLTYTSGAISIMQGSYGYTTNQGIFTGNPGLNGYGAGGGGAHPSTVMRGGLNAGNGAFSTTVATAGTANFGGGGGGGRFGASYIAAAAGGSGRCIIRYWS